MLVWEKATDDEGRTYYYNTETNETSWENPEESGSVEVQMEDLTDPVSLGQQSLSNWEKYTTEDGQVYYYNTITQESSWEVPSELKQDEAQDRDGDGVETSKSDSQRIPTSEDPEKLKELLSKYPNQSKIWSKKQLNNSITPKQLELAKTEFVDMLKEKEVDSSWPLTKVMETFIKDPRYWNIPDSLMKKELYESYLISKAEEEYEKSLNSKELFKKDFIKVLQKHNVEYFSRWRTFSVKIIDEPIYSLLSEKLKKELFNEYVKQLKKEHEEKVEESKKQPLEELREYLTNDLKLDLGSSFDDLMLHIKQDQRFKDNKHFELLTNLDILNTYDSIMKDLEVKHNSILRYHKLRNYNRDKNSRTEFKKLLEEKNKEVRITPKTTWFSFCSMIKDTPQFKDLVGRSGSSPIDYFWDLLDESGQFLNLQKNLVVSKFLDLQIQADQYDTLEKFLQICKDNELVQELNEEEMGYIFESLKESKVSKTDSEKASGTASRPRDQRDLSPARQSINYKTQRDEHESKPIDVGTRKMSIPNSGTGDLDY